MKIIVAIALILLTSISNADTFCQINHVTDKGKVERINAFTFSNFPNLNIESEDSGALSITLGETTYSVVSNNSFVAKTEVGKKMRYLVYKNSATATSRPDLFAEVTGSVARVAYLDRNEYIDLGVFSCK